MTPRLEWSGIGLFLTLCVAAVALTAWQSAVDRSVFERFVGALDPIVVMILAACGGAVALVYLHGNSDFAMLGPGRSWAAVSIVAWAVPALAVAAIAADLLLRFPEDTNVAVPDALRFYPAIAVFVECALHAVPVAGLVALLGAPSGLDVTFWRIAIPVALIEAVLQAAYAESIGTSIFSALHLVVFGVVQVWMFWRFGFAWMLGLRLAYYALWHVAWGAVRLELLF